MKLVMVVMLAFFCKISMLWNPEKQNAQFSYLHNYQADSMPKLSVVIITLNEEKNIGRCLSSVKSIADQIIIVDSGSTDQTLAIAKEFDANIIYQPFLGYIEQKNFALDCAGDGYILSLDGDESLSPELAAAILTEKQKGFQSVLYKMNRRNWFVDRWIMHGTWYPDTKMRLIKKGAARWGGLNPHDKLVPVLDQEIKHLEGDILHHTFLTMEDYLNQLNRFSSIAAKAMFEKGRRASWWNLIFNPFFAFVKSYFIAGGLKDGFTGYVIAKQTANLTFLKYAKLMQMQRSAS